MIDLIKRIFIYLRSNVKKSQLVIFGCGLLLIFSGIISWNVYFSKVYVFKLEEKKLLETVQNYYLYHSVYLPPKGEIKTLTLEELYQMKQIDTVYQPKSYDLCDTNSWVKVYNDGNDYHYYVYLKCGKFETNVDHEGPEITLKGDDTIYVSLGKNYDELGVEKVIDDKDGKMDISKVVIDSSRVNTKKVGNYKVTYKVRDTLNNETVVTRKVVVVRNLTDTVKDNTNESNYYQGNVNNNYLLFSGMMFRIINVNDDGTVTLISNELLNNLRPDYDNYENSNIDKFLNNDYLNIIEDSSYLVDTEFCVGNVDSLNDTSKNCDVKLKRKVAILDFERLKNTYANNRSYLCTALGYAVSSKVNNRIINVYTGGSNCLDTLYEDTLTAIRPVITLRSNLVISSGDGTLENPYKLDDYSYGKQQDKINTRLIGEYINYSGTNFRIIDIDKNNNVVLISVKPAYKNISSMTKKEYFIGSLNNEKFVFNLEDKNNAGYILNNEFIDYINDSYIIKSDYEIPLNSSSKNYNQYTTKKVSAKVVLPRTYDFFAGKQMDNAGYMYEYVFMDESEKEQRLFFVDLRNGRVYDSAKRMNEYTMRIVMTVNGDLLIKSGKGTVNSPYYIR